MKKQLLTLALLGMGIANAQTWSQDFTSATPPGLPAGWMQNNVDGNAVSTSISSYSFGTNAWVGRNATGIFPTNGNVAASTSWYTTAGISNDWLITPQFNVPAGSYLQWDGIALDPSYPDGYVVVLSTTGTNVAAFTTTLMTQSSESSSWATHVISLSAYVGQNVNIAFVNNSNDMYILYLDNIKCTVPAASDGNVVSITSVPRYTVSGSNVPVSGVFQNNGSAVANNATMNYRIDNGPVTTQTISVGALNYFQTANYTFSTQANLTAGAHTVKVWVSQVNGTNETILTNDTASTVVYVASQAKLRNALIEEFSSSTCVPCQNLNAVFDPLLQQANNNPNTGGRLNVIKYQMNWPSPGTDPSYNPEGDTRRGFYGVTGIPEAHTNGVNIMVNHNQTEIDAAKAEPAWADVTASISVVGNQITVNSTITPYVTISTNSPLRTFQVLTQHYYNFPGAVTTQKDYYHVQRKMFPDGSGSPVTVTDGVPFNATANYNVTSATTPAQGSFDFWTMSGIMYEYVVFVQDVISGDILNSGSASYVVTTGLAQLSKDARIGVYPNPAKDFAVVGIRLNNNSNVDINIYDVTGKVVYSNKGAQVQQGEQEIRINTTEFANGAYNIVVTTNEGVLKDKLIINK